MRTHEEFTSFYIETRDRCLRAVYASTGELHLAEDLVAEAYARALTGWSKVSKHPAPAAWIVRTALNLHVSWWRRRRREHSVGLPQDAPEHFDAAAVRASSGYEGGGPDGAGSMPDPALLAALSSLPRRQREVVVLRILLDLDTAATAQELGMAQGTVKVHLSRALAALRERLVPGVHYEVEDYVHGR